MQNSKDTNETQATHPQINKETMEFLKVKTSQTRDAVTMRDTFHLKGTSQQ
jgi:hypothetical protein